MKRLLKKPLMAALFGAGLAVVAPAYAQTCDPNDLECTPPPPPTTVVTAACSPGYFKNHVSTWCDAICPWSNTVVISGGQCTELLEKLNASGSRSSNGGVPPGVLKNLAASYINSACFVTRELSPCEDD